VVERAQAHHAQAVGRHGAEGEVGGGLGRAVGVHRRRQRVFIQWLAAEEGGAIDIGAGDEQQEALRRVAQDRPGEMQRAVQIDPPGVIRVVPRRRHGADGGEMDHRVG
jgi:hypothetical protein